MKIINFVLLKRCKHISLLVLFAVILACMTTLPSCSDDDSNDFASSRQDVEVSFSVSNGTLCFPDAESVYSYVDSVVNMPTDERVAFEHQLGFVSLCSRLEDLIDIYDNGESLLSMYPDYLSIEDSSIVITVPKFYSCLANGEGIFYVDGVVHKVSDRSIAYSVDGDESMVARALSGQAVDESVCRVKSYISPESHLKSYYDEKESVSSLATVTTTSGKYRIKYTVSVFIGIIRTESDETQAYWIEQKIKNEKKHLFDWKDHHCTTYVGRFFYTVAHPYYYDVDKTKLVYNYFVAEIAPEDDKKSNQLANYNRSIAISNKFHENLDAPKFIRAYGMASNSEFKSSSTSLAKHVVTINYGDWTDYSSLTDNYQEKYNF